MVPRPSENRQKVAEIMENVEASRQEMRDMAKERRQFFEAEDIHMQREETVLENARNDNEYLEGRKAVYEADLEEGAKEMIKMDRQIKNFQRAAIVLDNRFEQLKIDRQKDDSASEEDTSLMRDLRSAIADHPTLAIRVFDTLFLEELRARLDATLQGLEEKMDSVREHAVRISDDVVNKIKKEIYEGDMNARLTESLEVVREQLVLALGESRGSEASLQKKVNKLEEDMEQLVGEREQSNEHVERLIAGNTDLEKLLDDFKNQHATTESKLRDENETLIVECDVLRNENAVANEQLLELDEVRNQLAKVTQDLERQKLLTKSAEDESKEIAKTLKNEKAAGERILQDASQKETKLKIALETESARLKQEGGTATQEPQGSETASNAALRFGCVKSKTILAGSDLDLVKLNDQAALYCEDHSQLLKTDFIDHTNSALPEGTCLLQDDTLNVFMLFMANGAYIFDEEDVSEVVFGTLGEMTIHFGEGSVFQIR